MGGRGGWGRLGVARGGGGFLVVVMQCRSYAVMQGGAGIWGMGNAWRGGGGGGVALLGVWWWVGGGGMPVYSIQLGSSRHPRALRVRSTIQLTSIVTKGMTKSSEIDVVINNGDDDDDTVLLSTRAGQQYFVLKYICT